TVGWTDPHLWEGERQKGGFHHYDGRIPIIATGLQNLREHGPHGPVFLRFGRDHMEPLWAAIGNPRREAADARAREEARARQEEYQAQVRRAAAEQAEKRAGQPSVRPVVPSASVAGRSSPTNGGRWPARRTGESRRTPTRACVTAASNGPSSPKAKRLAGRSIMSR
ncbi:hypothetical protein J7I97_37740, partial [Streptomyces sp. ISL-87]|nr:hypothetical protein [Streptomyces sp. ISL-87]